MSEKEYIKFLEDRLAHETKVTENSMEMLRKLMEKTKELSDLLAQANDRARELEAQVYGGSTK